MSDMLRDTVEKMRLFSLITRKAPYWYVAAYLFSFLILIVSTTMFLFVSSCRSCSASDALMGFPAILLWIGVVSAVSVVIFVISVFQFG